MKTLLASLAATGGGGGTLGILAFQVGAIILIFYFLLMRPQKNARLKHEALLAGLKKGDDVTTAGGIIGRVKDIKEDRVTIESGTSTLVIERGRIVRVGETVSPTT